MMEIQNFENTFKIILVVVLLAGLMLSVIIDTWKDK